LLLEDPSEDVKTDNLLSAIQQFMEQASLGDFAARLKLLMAFHCNALHLPKSEYQGKNIPSGYT
jgi:hypothetical protein